MAALQILTTGSDVRVGELLIHGADQSVETVGAAKSGAQHSGTLQATVRRNAVITEGMNALS